MTSGKLCGVEVMVVTSTPALEDINPVSKSTNCTRIYHFNEGVETQRGNHVPVNACRSSEEPYIRTSPIAATL